MAKTVAALPVWKALDAAQHAGLRGESRSSRTGAQRDTDSTACGPPRLPDLFAVLPVGSRGEKGLPASTAHLVIVLTKQERHIALTGAVTRVTLQLYSVPDVGLKDGLPSVMASAAYLTLLAEIRGYDVEASGPFQQLIPNASGRGVLLVAPGCCAGVALPEARGHETPRDEQASAVVLVPPEGVEFVKVAWHPLSDVHAGVLVSNGRWQLLNLALRVAVEDPEVDLAIALDEGEPGERVADFTFGTPWAPGAGTVGAADAVWLAVSVFFLSTRGRISGFSPVLPAVSTFPEHVLSAFSPSSSSGGASLLAEDALAAGAARIEVHEWLCRTLFLPEGRTEVPMPGERPGSFASFRHPLHKHGDSHEYYHRWTPLEQVVFEESREIELTPRSPRHKRGDYCSLHLVAHVPTTIAARATTTGLLELLIFSEMLAPRFASPDGLCERSGGLGLVCTVFEEIDLVLNQSLAPSVRLSPMCPAEPGGVAMFARTRGLVAAVELPWVSVLIGGSCDAPVEQLPPSTVTTLVEMRATDGPGDLAGWQAAGHLAGVWLGIGGPAASCAAAGAVDVGATLRDAAKGRAGKALPATPERRKRAGIGPGQVPEREEYLRRISGSVLSQPLFGGVLLSAGEGGDLAAAAVAKAVAGAEQGQVANLKARQHVLKHLLRQLPARSEGMRNDAEEARRNGELLREAAQRSAQKVVEVRRLQGELQQRQAQLVKALEGELELRQLDGVATGDLQALWAELYELRRALELLRSAAGPQNPPEASRISADHLATTERLQQAWAGASADQLRMQAEELEASVSAAKRLSADRRRGVTTQ